jgi:hypothetical protein
MPLDGTIPTVTPEDERQMLDYLLGRLNDSERTELERRYFSDQQLFERLCALEDDLVDQSLSGVLSEKDERLFTSRYLQLPHLREKVEFARALKEAALSLRMTNASALVASRSQASLPEFLPVTNRRILTFAAAAIVIALVGFSWLLFHHRRIERELQQANRELARRQQITDQPAPHVKPSGTDPLIVSFVLTPGAVRAPGKAKRLLIPSQAELVRFTIELHKESPRYSSYRAVLQTAEFAEVWSETALTPASGDSKNRISIVLPSKVLPAGDYVLHIQGTLSGGKAESVASYTFRVLLR